MSVNGKHEPEMKLTAIAIPDSLRFFKLSLCPRVQSCECADVFALGFPSLSLIDNLRRWSNIGDARRYYPVNKVDANLTKIFC